MKSEKSRLTLRRSNQTSRSPLKVICISLTDKILTSNQEEQPHHFEAEDTPEVKCEILFEGEVNVESTFKQEIVAEASNTRGNFNSNIIEPRHIEAYKQLKADLGITIKKADKIDAIHNYESKFTKITRPHITSEE